MLKKVATIALFTLLVTPHVASALSFSDIFSSVESVVAGLFSGSSQTAAVSGSTVPSTLTVKTDAGAAWMPLVALGEETFAGAYAFSASGSAYTVQELRIKIPSDSATSVQNVKLVFTTQNQVGNSAVQSVRLPNNTDTHGVATFTGLNMYVPKDGMAVLSVFLTSYGDKAIVKPGVVLSVALDTTTGFKAIDSGGTVVTSVGSGDIQSEAYIYPRHTYPVVTRIPIRSMNTPVVPGTALFKFKVGTHVRGDIEWHKISFDIQAAGFSIGDFTLYDVTNGVRAVNTIPANGANSTTISICPGASCADTGIEGVPAGGERVYELRAGTVDGWGDKGDSLSIGVFGDEAPAPVSTMLSQQGNMVWSDRSAMSHSASSKDWFNGFAVPIPGDRTTFVVSGASSTASKIKVTAPNGGEKWDVSSMNTITWSPYGYNPDVNPPWEVVAWLDQRTNNGGTKTVGRIVPSGKASIHWEGDIDPGNGAPHKKVEPGTYEVRIENVVTGETDRSDKPFTLSRSTDLRVNNSDGPVKVDTSKPVKLAWKSVGTKSCEIHNAYKDISRTEQIGSVKTTWFVQAYLHPSWGPSLVCQKDGKSVSDYVPIEVKQGPASVKITKPNGGEKIDPKSQLDITFQYANVNSFSLALYKNDKWVYWIAKDNPLEPYANVHTVSWLAIQDALTDLGEATTTGAVYKFYVTASKLDGSGYVDDKTDRTFSFVVPPAPKQPVISKFSASPAKILLGKSSTLSWSVTNAMRCVLNDGKNEEVVKTTGTKKVTPSGNTTYGLWCANDSGDGKDGPSASKLVEVTVDTPALKTPTITRFTATPASVKGSQPTVLSWATKDATSCLIASPRGKEGGEVNGKLSVSVTENTTFTLYCGNTSADGRTSPEVSKQVSVKFTPAVAPSCTITSDKKLYRLGDTAKITWKSKDATSALWIPDMSGKDTIAPPNAVPTPNGSASVKVTVGGAPTLTLMVKGNGGEATCQVVLQGVPPFVESSPSNDMIPAPPMVPHTPTTPSDDMIPAPFMEASALSALQSALQAVLSIMR